MAELGEVCEHAAGARLFSLGDLADAVYVIHSGSVSLRLPVTIMSTQREVAVDTLHAGQMLGWSALVPPHRLTMSAMMKTDGVLWRFPRESLESVFAADPVLGLKLMRNLASVIGRRFMMAQAMLVRQLQQSLDHGLIRQRKR
jgi:CRP-like cAMP-binding protein